MSSIAVFWPMPWRQRVLQLLLVSVLIVNAFSTGVAAQSQPRQILLDTDVRKLAEVHTNGQLFVVYAIENALPYSSGIAVYADGERVTSKATVDDVFRALARRKATKFEPERQTIQRLRRVVERSQAVQAATSVALVDLNRTLQYREELKATPVNQTTAWVVALDRSDALDRAFDSGFSGSSDGAELRNELLVIHRSAAALEANARRVITLLERRQDGQEINQSALYRRYDSIYADLETMNRQLRGLERELSTFANTSRAAGSQVSSVPTVGGELEQRFTMLARALNASADRLADTRRAFVTLQEALPAVAANADFQTQLTQRWKQRLGAVTKVYVSITEGLIFFLAGIIALLETEA